MVIPSSISLVKYQFRKENIELSYEHSNSSVTNLDKQKIEQVIVNLLINAIHAVKLNGKITISLVKEKQLMYKGEVKDFLKIEVSDNGCGIDPQNIDVIFDPFFTTKDIGEGTGLGLSISCGIIEEHNGWIDVESHIDEGSSFFVYLPIDNQV